MKTKARKIESVAKLLKYRYASYLARDSSNKWSNIMTSWVPHLGRRGRGRPNKRWIEELRKPLWFLLGKEG